MASARQFHRAGYCIVEHAIAQELLASLGKAIDSIAVNAALYPDALQSNLVREPAKDGEASAVFIIGDPSAFSEAFEPLLAHPRIHRLASELLGSERLIYHFANVTIKHPHAAREIA